jgi:ADP-heptose:LPS heptosyltransferase
MSAELRAAAQRREPGAALEIRRVAVLRALFLGDLLMTTPALRALRRRFPRAEVTLIGLPWAEQLVARMPHLVDRFVAFSGYPGLAELPYDQARTAAFLAEQRAYGYDLAIQMHGDGTVTNAVVADLGARISAGLARPGDNRLDVALPYPDDAHEIRRWLGLAAALGAPAGDTALELRPAPEDEAWADALLGRSRGGPLVGLHVGAKDPGRRWPAARFAALGQALYRKTGARLVLTGGHEDRPLGAEVAALSQRPPLDLTGRTDIGSFAAVVRRLDLLVTNDTGASHVAAAVGAPSVVLFGPTRPAQFAPLDRDCHRVVDALEYAPAGADGAEALRSLPLQPVLEAALSRLAAGRAVTVGVRERAVGEEAR